MPQSLVMRSQRGFSLLEVLVALLILALVITTTLAIFLERNRRLQQANEIILAYQALSNEAEVRRRIDFDDLDDAGTTFITDKALLQPLAPFTTEVTVTPLTASVKNVRMTIRWNDGKREAKLELVRADTGAENLW